MVIFANLVVGVIRDGLYYLFEVIFWLLNRVLGLILGSVSVLFIVDWFFYFFLLGEGVGVCGSCSFVLVGGWGWGVSKERRGKLEFSGSLVWFLGFREDYFLVGCFFNWILFSSKYFFSFLSIMFYLVYGFVILFWFFCCFIFGFGEGVR